MHHDDEILQCNTEWAMAGCSPGQFLQDNYQYLFLALDSVITFISVMAVGLTGERNICHV